MILGLIHHQEWIELTYPHQNCKINSIMLCGLKFHQKEA